MSAPASPTEGQTLGRFYGIGTGPGDPELMTLKAVRLVRACPVVAWFTRKGSPGNAWRTASAVLDGHRPLELPLVYPVTVELPPDHPEYHRQIEAFFDQSAEQVAEHLQAGRSVAILNEGDPFFYGSFMHLHIRLVHRFPGEVVPGVTSMVASAAQLPVPLMMRDDILSVIPGTLSEPALVQAITAADATVIMKLGSNLPKVRRAVATVGRTGRAWYVERASMEQQRVMPLAEAPAEAPYFSMVVIPGQGGRR